MWDNFNSFIAFLFASGIIINYSSGFIADPKKNNISEKRKHFSNFMFNLGLTMFWSSIILVFISAWFTNK